MSGFLIPIGPDEDPIETIALHHFARERSGDPQAREALQRWLDADPHHQACYDELRCLWDDLLRYQSEPAILTLREEALQTIQARPRRRRMLAAVSASALLLAGVGGVLSVHRSMILPKSAVTALQQHYTTRVGQILSVTLPDGSMAVLDTNSSIQVSIGSAGARRVTVGRGRALFKVMKMANRPFIVEAGPVAVTARGTRFDVYRKANQIEVNLFEGRVHVEQTDAVQRETSARNAQLEMTAGDNLQISRTDWLIARGRVGKGAGWVNGQIAFDNEPISAIVAELNRYTDRPFIVGDPDVGAYRVSAVVRSSNPRMFLNALQTMGIAHVKQIPQGYLIEHIDNK